MPVPVISVLTPVLPTCAHHLTAAGRSVQALREAIGAAKVEWIVVADGPGDLDGATGADHVHRLSTRCGVATARTAALGMASGRWVFPLDGDDVLEPAGVAALIEEAGVAYGWVSGNRVLMDDGARTAHWCDAPRTWALGELAERWTAPFAFHPNTVLADRQVALAAGGWPALPVNEDLAWVLRMSELAVGRSCVATATQYRRWPGQQVAAGSYAEQKRAAFLTIEAMHNAGRALLGRASISSPESPGGAHGLVRRL